MEIAVWVFTPAVPYGFTAQRTDFGIVRAAANITHCLRLLIELAKWAVGIVSVNVLLIFFTADFFQEIFTKCP